MLVSAGVEAMRIRKPPLWFAIPWAVLWLNTIKLWSPEIARLSMLEIVSIGGYSITPLLIYTWLVFAIITYRVNDMVMRAVETLQISMWTSWLATIMLVMGVLGFIDLALLLAGIEPQLVPRVYDFVQGNVSPIIEEMV